LPTIVYEIIKDHGFTSNQTDEVIKLLNSDSGKYIRSSSHRILKNRKWIIISPVDTTKTENIVIEENSNKIDFAAGTLKFENLQTTNYKLQTTNDIACINADEIKYPLLLRKWKQGDYFYPLGMNKKKKLSRFFIDQKLSLIEKENIWVLEANKKIIWAVGKRIDDRFKITPSTKNILKITLS
jgi:tRNA(Ile)-lysidine synthase